MLYFNLIKGQKRILLFVIFVVFTTVNLFSQIKLVTIQDREYRLKDRKWYIFSEGKRGSEIIPQRLIVRLKDKGFLEHFDF